QCAVRAEQARCHEATPAETPNFVAAHALGLMPSTFGWHPVVASPGGLRLFVRRVVARLRREESVRAPLRGRGPQSMCSFVSRNRIAFHSDMAVSRCQRLRARKTLAPVWSSATLPAFSS